MAATTRAPSSSCRVTGPTVPTAKLLQAIAANMNNAALSDAQFRAFVRRSLPPVARQGLRVLRFTGPPRAGPLPGCQAPRHHCPR
jgi:hypothetical protein